MIANTKRQSVELLISMKNSVLSWFKAAIPAPNPPSKSLTFPTRTTKRKEPIHELFYTQCVNPKPI